jgi:ATP synthase subunit 6
MNCINYSPLEIFEIHPLWLLPSVTSIEAPGQIPSTLLLVTNASIFLSLAFIACVLLFGKAYFPSNLIKKSEKEILNVVNGTIVVTRLIVPKKNYVRKFLEALLIFVEKMIKENVVAANNKVLQVYSPYISSIFLTILSINYIGMVPYSFTSTSSLIITLSLTLASYIGLNGLGATIHKLGFLALFVPPGCPLVIAPFIILVETLSYLARVFSLSIRLFANMMAGHTLLKILSGFA